MGVWARGRRVLVTQLLRCLRLAHIHPAVLRFPSVDGVQVRGFAPVFCPEAFPIKASDYPAKWSTVGKHWSVTGDLRFLLNFV
jgi:hypothetical protein